MISLLKEIRIYNYKIFGGENVITLSTNTEKPITLVTTLTASGKTTLVEAVAWCLGEEKDNRYSKSLLNCEKMKTLVIGEETIVRVELTFEIVNFNYCFRRECLVKKISESEVTVVNHKYYINNIEQNLYGYSFKVNDILPFWHFAMTLWDERIGMERYSKVIQREVYRYIGKNKPIDEFFSCIENDANNIFSKLSFRTGLAFFLHLLE